MPEAKATVDVKVGQTPQGQIVAEVPRISAPSMAHNLFGVWGYWLGNPTDRYGRLQPSNRVPLAIKLQMLKHPVIAMCTGFTGATLVNAKREIHCKSKRKQRFFEAMFAKWEREFILQANVGIALGSIGLIKRWKFEVPEPTEVDDRPVWNGAATPFVIVGFDQVQPLMGNPVFDPSGRHFEGIETQDGKIDVFYSLWLTFRKEWAFGSYMGAGRLDSAYKDWWQSEFGGDVYLVAMQKQGDRVALVGYPPGKDTNSGKDNQTIALETGDAVRSGATVAMPSLVYPNLDEAGMEAGMTSVRQWSLQFLEGATTVGQFHEIDDHHAQRMAIGLLVPPQAFMNVKQSALGGPTTADVLTKLAIELLMQDSQDIDRHLNEYVFPAISRANFPADSPPVYVRTVGLDAENEDQMMEVIKELLKADSSEVATMFDMRAAMERLEFPLRSEAEIEKLNAEKDNVPQTPQAPEETQTDETPQEGQTPDAPQSPTQPTRAIAGAVADGKVVAAGGPLPRWGDEAVPISADDVASALVAWEDRAPEAARGLLVALTLNEGEGEA